MTLSDVLPPDRSGGGTETSGSLTKLALYWRFAGLSDRGRVRAENQDRWFADADSGLFLVADGIGGAASGGLAAEVVILTFPSQLRSIQRPSSSPSHPGEDHLATTVRDAIVQLSEQLRVESQQRPHLAGMGSTLVVAVACDGGAVIGHLGDSRAYRLRGDQLQQLTTDHSLLQLLAQSENLSRDELDRHPARGQLTRFAGMPSPALPEVQEVELQPGDRLLLCSDGVSGELSDTELADLLGCDREPASVVGKIIAAVNEAGGRDNSTAIVIFVESKAASLREAAGSMNSDAASESS